MERNQLIHLVEAAQNGDEKAMNELFNAFYNDVYYFALKTIKDSETACDITQETFVSIITSLKELKEPAAFVTWMKQIAYSQCTRYFRKMKDILVDEDEDGNTAFDVLVEDRAEFIPDEALDQEDFRKTILGMLDSPDGKNCHLHSGSIAGSGRGGDSNAAQGAACGAGSGNSNAAKFLSAHVFRFNGATAHGDGSCGSRAASHGPTSYRTSGHRAPDNRTSDYRASNHGAFGYRTPSGTGACPGGV